jgi:UDP-N-acetylglucosamine acyltransferase
MVLAPLKFNKASGPRPVRKAEIHPSAVVSPEATLGHDVRIGPHAVIGPDVVLGPGCVVGSSVLIEGRTVIGRNNQFFHGTAIGSIPQDLKYRGEESSVEIGNNSLVMAYVHIAHNCHIHNDVVIANAVNLAGHVEVEDHAIIGGMTPVHQFVRVGSFAFVGGASRLSQDVPPFIKVAGNPIEVAGVNSIGLKRHNFSDDELMNLKKAYRLLYRSGLNVSQALERIASDCRLTKHTEDLMAFIRRSERGIVR